MTDLYIKQHVFTIGERFTVYGEDGSERFYVEGEVFSLPKTFHISDAAGNEVAEISRRLFSFPVKYDVSADGCDVTISKKITFIYPSYTVEELGWRIEGEFLRHEYEITNEDGVVATVSKEWFTFGDAYRLRVMNDGDVLTALCALIVIDACLATSNNG